MKALAAGVAAAVLLAACAADTGNPLQAVKEKFASPGETKTVIANVKPGPYQPSSLAQGVDKDLAQRRSLGPGFVHAETVETYLGSIRDRLTGATGVTGIPGRTRILADSSLNAYSTADGNIYVPLGWVEYIDSEDEIAALLAHELSHVVLKHHSSDQVSTVQKQSVAVMTNAIEIQKNFNQAATALQSQTGSRTPLRSSTTTDETGKRALHRVQWSINVTDKALLPAWSRTQEREADLLAIDLLVKAGYNPSAMTSILAKIKANEPTRADDDKARQTQLNAALDEAGKGNWEDAARAAFPDLLASMTRSHPDTDERIAQCGAYLQRHYGSVNPPALNVASWKKVEGDPRTNAIFDNFAKSFSAEQMLRKGDVKVAYTLAKQAVAGPTARESFTNWVASLAAELNNATNDARRYAQAAVAAPEPVNAAFESYVSLLEGEGRYPQALVEAGKASSSFGEVATWKVTRIRLMRKAGDEAGAKQLERECGLQNPEFKRQCDEAGNTPLGRSARVTPSRN